MKKSLIILSLLGFTANLQANSDRNKEDTVFKTLTTQEKNGLRLVPLVQSKKLEIIKLTGSALGVLGGLAILIPFISATDDNYIKNYRLNGPHNNPYDRQNDYNNYQRKVRAKMSGLPMSIVILSYFCITSGIRLAKGENSAPNSNKKHQAPFVIAPVALGIISIGSGLLGVLVTLDLKLKCTQPLAKKLLRESIVLSALIPAFLLLSFKTGKLAIEKTKTILRLRKEQKQNFLSTQKIA